MPTSPDETAVTAREVEFTLAPPDNARLAELCGRLDEHLHQIEAHFDVAITNRGHHFRVRGPRAQAFEAARVVKSLYEMSSAGPINAARVHAALTTTPAASQDETTLRTPKGPITGRTERQREYVRAILTHDVTFGIGPAGTGKTYLAVACAVDALERDQVSRIVLVRPAVEAGERLGFLPGGLEEKVDPYLRPLYDALYEMLGFDKVGRLLERNVIEVAPLAYMRGRTLNESFIILDEAQNTTTEQMKMFLTRIGFGARAVVTGDLTQVDLPRGQKSGLREASEVLTEVKGVGFMRFTPQDVVRNPLVARIVEAYEANVPRED
jgi:phosphate starvation-inducible PhoH-like protein